MTDQPMTPERLAEIRGHYTQGPGLVDPEVERLISEVRRLQEQLRLANIDAFDNGNHAEEVEAGRDEALARVAELEQMFQQEAATAKFQTRRALGAEDRAEKAEARVAELERGDE